MGAREEQMSVASPSYAKAPRPLTIVAEQGQVEHQEGGDELHSRVGLSGCPWDLK